MCDIKFDGEMIINTRMYKYINGEYFTRYYWYNHSVECWCGYIGISEEIFNQLDENYAGNTFLGRLDNYHFVIGNDDRSFNGIQAKLDYMEEQLLKDYGVILRNDNKHNEKLLRTKTIMECKLVVAQVLCEYVINSGGKHLDLLSELNKVLSDRLSKLQED